MIRVVIADDHPLVVDALRDLVNAQPDLQVVAVMEDGNQVIDRIETLPCDVLVLDLSLPGATGYAVLSHLQHHAPHVQTLVYTMYPESLVRRGVLAAGAAGWICKRRPPPEILTAIRQAAAGHRAVVDEAAAPAPHEALTPRQQELFLLICEGASPGDLVRRLDLSPSTVSSHLAAIRERLGVDTNGEILLYAMSAGLLAR